MTDIRKHLIKAGVKNLKAFGYKNCSEKTILTDEIYKAFFLRMLEENLGKGYDKEINALIEEIK